MKDIKPGDVVFVQTSQEPVFILDIKEGTSLQRYPGLSGQVATVRRPSEGREGIRHSVEFFSVEELETLAARQFRQLQEMEEMKNAVEKHRGKAPATPDQLSSIN